MAQYWEKQGLIGNFLLFTQAQFLGLLILGWAQQRSKKWKSYKFTHRAVLKAQNTLKHSI